ncbi:hypothetical protein E2C01_068629 [Portunus trituberculatus]|uniref:Uncharacterized protein n=1 Tax=Portunus trituberculatus TaxID=210409 RepID=A0A5B7HSH2_PORTR|nr:hypothetical protein [Portunus trituberculatus]
MLTVTHNIPAQPRAPVLEVPFPRVAVRLRTRELFLLQTIHDSVFARFTSGGILTEVSVSEQNSVK